MLLAELVRQFPLPITQTAAQVPKLFIRIRLLCYFQWYFARNFLIKKFAIPILGDYYYYFFQTNGVTVKTENNDKSGDKPVDGTVNNITIKQEPAEPSGSEMTNGTMPHTEIKTEIKQENMKPPPEKKPRAV